MKTKTILPIIYALTICAISTAQQVPILAYAIDDNQQVHITVASTEDHYYVLHVRPEPTGTFEQATSISIGKNGTTTLTEPLSAYPIENYKVTEHLIAQPADTDMDGLDDMVEFADLGTKSPLNAAPAIHFHEGLVYIPDRLTFKKLSYQEPAGTSGANDLEVLKFYMTDRESAEPKLYFVNSNNYSLHTDFASAVGLYNNGTLMTGTIAFHPSVVSANGTLGTYRFFFQPNNLFSFKYVQKAIELLAANMPFLKNNLCYYPLEQVQLPLYYQEQTTYDASRICVLLEADLYADVDYLALHVAEGYGLLRVMNINELPGPRDVVLYEALPNELPRVGGIITTVMQTPLSHVNLRAIQDDVPNAFIRNALQQAAIDTLIGKYVYYQAGPTGFTIRSATQAEVDAFYESIRPKAQQIPVRDLSKTKIEPLDSISFAESASFGVKCANVATMRTFGFPDGTIPDGYGVPFYFYDEFMKYNGFYTRIQSMLADASFQADYNIREQQLADFRSDIKNGSMPPWMLDQLRTMQQSFPVGISIRCRSSTNNEDLPGFSGAGLYDSKTQHPNEGHIAKSIKQVYASMWNFRAFEEREFYRVDHLTAAMGVLVHPNHENEKANGVGVSTDPIYKTEGTFYLNTQLGEDLVTNPNALSVPEEILLDAVSSTDDDYFVMSPSNQVPMDTLLMKEIYLDQMRAFLSTIHTKFQVLYNAVGKTGFAMEIEYKINAENQLTIKQARPWASYWGGENPPTDTSAIIGLKAYPNPFHDVVHLECDCDQEISIEIYNLIGQKVATATIDFRKSQRELYLGQLDNGVYFWQGLDKTGGRFASGKWVKI